MCSVWNKGGLRSIIKAERISRDSKTYERLMGAPTLIKKENKIFLIYTEIQMESGAKSYMGKGFLIYEEMHKYFHHI